MDRQMHQSKNGEFKNDVVVSVKGIGKLYQLFDHPQDRLKHMLFWRFGKSYGHPFWAVRNITFDLHRGEMLAIIGKNGSGKSTLLQMITGILPPTEGAITVNGRIGALLELGSGFNPEYTGRENIQLNASILGISPEELKEATQSIIDFADIGEFIDQPVKLYSSGMFVRLAFAVTTSLKSDVLLIDEALAVGDVFFRQKCYTRLQELRKKGVSIILVTHAMGDVEQFCENAIVLRRGEEVFQGPAVEAVKWYYLEDQKVELPENCLPDEGKNFGICEDQPPDEFCFDLSAKKEISNGWARCTFVALSDRNGKAVRLFQQGEEAHFIYEFEMLRDIEVPNCGIVLHNDKGWTVHGKGSLLYGIEVPLSVKKGSRIRMIQEIKLDLEAGEYTFEVALNTMPADIYLSRSEYSPVELYSKVTRLCFVPDLGPFAIVNRASGVPVSLSHHGIANLPGSAEIIIRDSAGRG